MKFTRTNVPASAAAAREQGGSSESAMAGWLQAGRRYGLALVAGLVLVGLSAWLASRWRGPAPVVPAPAHLDQLEPQLRDYIIEKVNWVKSQPRSPDRQTTLGLVYAANSLWTEARQSFSNVVQLSPKEPLARLYLAVTIQELGDPNEAARILQDLTARFPTFAPGYYRLGDISLRLGAIDQAERAFERLTQLAPQEWRGYAGLGEAKLRQGQNAPAAALLEKAIQLDPQAKSAHHQLGLAYRALGRQQDAALELMLGLNPVVYPMPDAWSSRAPEHMKLLQDQFDMANDLEAAGQPDKAVALLGKALAYHPQNVGLLNNLAIALNRAGEPRKARQVLGKALELKKDYLPAYITLAYTCQALGSNDIALRAADQAIALSPNTAQAHVAKANALLGMERDQDALAALQEAFRCDPQNAEIQLEMGDICWRNLNAPDKALEHYLTATNLNLALAPAYVRLGDFYLHRGDSKAAQPVLQMLRRLSPHSPELPALEERWRKVTAAAVRQK